MYFVPFLNGVRIFISVFLKGLRVSVLSVLTIGLSFSPADNNLVFFPA